MATDPVQQQRRRVRRAHNAWRLAACMVVATLGLAGCWQSHTRGAGDAGPSAPRRDSGLAADTGTTCPAGTGYFEPGCTSEPALTLDAAGCYTPCTDVGAACPSVPFSVCRAVVTNPCLCAPGAPCCAACGVETLLCLPPLEPPPPCSALSYCDCQAGCEPLIDLTTGCICPCDEPFLCGGPPCDCDCGGATYLGCAPAGLCPEPEVTCASGVPAHLAGGCPSCALGP